MKHNFVIIAIGSNAAGVWGRPDEAVTLSIEHFRRDLGDVIAVSPLYLTEPIGGVKQAPFTNAIAVVKSHLPSAQVIRYFKKLEREAGRRSGTSRRWGSRPLDIDLIDHGGRIIGWRRNRANRGPGPVTSPLVLPHPRAHERAFVLVPLRAVSPHWVHPVLGKSVRQLLERIAPSQRRSVLVMKPPVCDAKRMKSVERVL